MQESMLTPCSDWEEKLAVTRPDNLSTTEWEALRDHVHHCSACADFLAACREMDRLISAAFTPQRPLLLPPVLLRLREPIQGIEAYFKLETHSTRSQTSRFLKTFIGDYYITGQIATSILGSVYQGNHLQVPNRIFAIKLLHTMPSNFPEEQEQFLQEVQLLDKLRHPHILPVIDTGIHEGLPYVVTEYVSHGSLQTLLDQHSPYPLPVEQALSILSQIGQTLQYAHQWNFIHSDLKPSHILFNAQGEVVLTDFASVASVTKATSREEAMMSVHPYIAPEQLLGETSQHSNQYALACIAYRLLTGRAPLESSDKGEVFYGQIFANSFGSPPLDARLAASLEEVIFKAMAKQPTDRYPVVSAFLDALTQAYRSTGSI